MVEGTSDLNSVVDVGCCVEGCDAAEVVELVKGTVMSVELEGDVRKR